MSENSPSISPNEVRITALGKRKNYIAYALSLLTGERHDLNGGANPRRQPHGNGKPETTITIKAMGRAMDKAVAVCEIVKRRVLGLHQLTELSSSEVIDTYEPTEEGLKPVHISHRISSICITLSKEPLDTTKPGYQPPLPASEVTPEHYQSAASTSAAAAPSSSSSGGESGAANSKPPFAQHGGRGRGGRGGGAFIPRGRGGRGGRGGFHQQNGGDENGGGDRGGRGGGRGGRGGRGGLNPQRGGGGRGGRGRGGRGGGAHE